MVRWPVARLEEPRVSGHASRGWTSDLLMRPTFPWQPSQCFIFALRRYPYIRHLDVQQRQQQYDVPSFSPPRAKAPCGKVWVA